MANYKKYNLLLFFLLTGMLLITDYSFSNENNLKPEYFYGKVVYSDSNIPVNNGQVRIISVNNTGWFRSGCRAGRWAAHATRWFATAWLPGPCRPGAESWAQSAAPLARR